jgi:methionyl aminopeptidase
VLDACAAAVRPGVTTDELDRIAHEVTVAGGGYPSPLNYCSFPKSCCTSVNEVICHGIPDARPLEDGDIVNLDISVFLGGFHADLNETVLCGNVDAAGRALVKGAWDCLAAAIAIVKPGTRFRDPGDVISTKASQAGLSVVRTYCGHGIGCVLPATLSRGSSADAGPWTRAGSCFTARPTSRTTATTRRWG